jgi:hypothetical protein
MAAAGGGRWEARRCRGRRPTPRRPAGGRRRSLPVQSRALHDQHRRAADDKSSEPRVGGGPNQGGAVQELGYGPDGGGGPRRTASTSPRRSPPISSLAPPMCPTSSSSLLPCAITQNEGFEKLWTRSVGLEQRRTCSPAADRPLARRRPPDPVGQCLLICLKATGVSFGRSAEPPRRRYTARWA